MLTNNDNYLDLVQAIKRNFRQHRINVMKN